MTIDEKQARKNLEDRGFLVSYGIVGSYQENVRIREHSILSKGQAALRTNQEMATSAAVSPSLKRRFHFELLDLLTNVCMFVEDFACMAYALDHHPRSLHWPIYFTGSTRVQQLKELSEAHGKTLRARLRMPRVSKLGLPADETVVVRRVISRYIEGVRNDLTTLWEFSERGFFGIYNEYKHSFDILTGDLGQGTGLDNECILIRSTKRRKSGKPREETLLLEASADTLCYLNSIFCAVSNLLNCLIWNSLDFMLYADGKYLVKLPRDYPIPDFDMEIYHSLPDKRGLHWSNAHSSLPSIKFIGDAQESALEQLREKHIAILKQPLIDRRAQRVVCGIQNVSQHPDAP